jgi:hypothetical protein
VRNKNSKRKKKKKKSIADWVIFWYKAFVINVSSSGGSFHAELSGVAHKISRALSNIDVHAKIQGPAV